MDIDTAVQGWTDLTYCKDSGLKDSTGELTHPGSLGCSGFISIVYHRMRYGTDWLKYFNFEIQKQYGDEAARMMGFNHIGTRMYTEWQSDAPENALYFFNIRIKSYGHVGFVKINSTDWKTYQYSEMKSGRGNGYFNRGFEEWLSMSMYKNSPIELYSTCMRPSTPSGFRVT